jgi:hypothetical protein
VRYNPGVGQIEDRFARQARNEALFREVNERIAELGESARAWSPGDTVEIFCECGAEDGCGARITVPVGVYDGVRQQDDRFLVLAGHEVPELERAVQWTDEYVIVDKLPEAEPYVADDPRGSPSG